MRLPKRTGRNPRRPNMTAEMDNRVKEALSRLKETPRIEIGNPWMTQVCRAGLDRYTPLLGGYPLQAEWRGDCQVSCDNLREIIEQLGKPFLVTAREHGVLFFWNGSLGGTKTYAAVGFPLDGSPNIRATFMSVCSEIGVEVGRIPSRRTLRKQWASGAYWLAHHDRLARDFNSVSKKRWTEADVA